MRGAILRAHKKTQARVFPCLRFIEQNLFLSDFIKSISSSIIIIIAKKIAYPSMPAESTKGDIAVIIEYFLMKDNNLLL